MRIIFVGELPSLKFLCTHTTTSSNLALVSLSLTQFVDCCETETGQDSTNTPGQPEDVDMDFTLLYRTRIASLVVRVSRLQVQGVKPSLRLNLTVHLVGAE